jgi:FdhD protein
MTTEFAASRVVTETARRGGDQRKALRRIAEEVAIALSYGGSTEAVMMASPSDLEDFAVGFSLSEGIIGSPGEIIGMEVIEVGGGIDIQMRLAEARESELKGRRRAKAGPVGCGLCGVESIEEALRPVADVSASSLTISPEEITAAVKALSASQPLNGLTRATHAAGFFVPGEGMVTVREDVGRHNALDKLIGHLARNGIDGARGAVVMTSRVSVELVQKTAGLGSPVLLAISAPTGLAIEMAAKAGMSLVALVRDEDYEIFTGEDRVVDHAALHLKTAI